MWNSFVSPFFRANVDIRQEFVLSFILSILYFSLIFGKRAKTSFQTFLFHFFLQTQNLISKFYKQALCSVSKIRLQKKNKLRKVKKRKK